MMLSLGTVLYLIAKTLPRIDDTPPKEISLETHWVSRHLEQMDQKIKLTSEKALGKTNAVLLNWQDRVSVKMKSLKEDPKKDAPDITSLDDKKK